MRTDAINWMILHIEKKYTSPFYNIYIRFYNSDNSLITIMRIEKSLYYKYKGAYFADLSYLLEFNNHCDYFDLYNYSFKNGVVSCHGHGEFYGIDKLYIDFKRNLKV